MFFARRSEGESNTQTRRIERMRRSTPTQASDWPRSPLAITTNVSRIAKRTRAAVHPFRGHALPHRRSVPRASSRRTLHLTNQASKATTAGVLAQGFHYGYTSSSTTCFPSPQRALAKNQRRRSGRHATRSQAETRRKSRSAHPDCNTRAAVPT